MPCGLGKVKHLRLSEPQSRHPWRPLCVARLGLQGPQGRPLLPMQGQLPGRAPDPRASDATRGCWAVCRALRGDPCASAAAGRQGDRALPKLLLLPIPALPMLLLPLLMLLLLLPPDRAPLWPSSPQLPTRSYPDLMLHLRKSDPPARSLIRPVDRSGLRDPPHPSGLRLSPCSASCGCGPRRRGDALPGVRGDGGRPRACTKS